MSIPRSVSEKPRKKNIWRIWLSVAPSALRIPIMLVRSRIMMKMVATMLKVATKIISSKKITTLRLSSCSQSKSWAYWSVILSILRL